MIKLANKSDFNKIKDFYVESSKDSNNLAKWHYGIYPSDEDLLERIEKKQLYYLGTDEMFACGALELDSDPMYKNANWVIDDAATIHLLATNPKYYHHGYSKKLLHHLISIVKNHNIKAIHLDVMKGNQPAINLYTSFGFQFIQDYEVVYPDTGKIVCLLYEKVM